VRIAIDGHEHPAARFDDARQLADAQWHVGEEHHAELRAGDVEAVVFELERVAVHHACLHAQPLVARAPLEPLEHRRREVGGEHVGSEPRRRDGERAASGRHVEEPRPRAHPGAAQALVAQPHLRRGVRAVVAGRDVVPRDACLRQLVRGHVDRAPIGS
jgi:hypothetical protein